MLSSPPTCLFNNPEVTFLNIRSGILNIYGEGGGVTWLVLGFYVPLLLVSLALITWQLDSMHGESIEFSRSL